MVPNDANESTARIRGRQWLALVIVAGLAGVFGGFLTGILAGGWNFYIYTPNNNARYLPADDLPTVRVEAATPFPETSTDVSTPDQ